MLNQYCLKENIIEKRRLEKSIDDFIVQKIFSNQNNIFVAKVESKLDKNIFTMKRIEKNKEKNKENQFKNLLFCEEFFPKILNHENIVKYFTSFEDDKYLYIITEYVNNGDLLKILKDKRKNLYKISEKKLIKIFLGCLSALSYIHSCGIIFRALKPEKILINNENEVKFTNFKYAAVDNEHLAKENLKITNEELEKAKIKFEKIDCDIYQAPEMEKNGIIYDNRIDIYSLGIIFKYLTSFYEKKNINNNEYSPELYNLISKMIEKERTKRPSAKEAYQELKNIYIEKYSYYTGIISCLRCLNSLPNFQKLLDIKKEDENSFLNQIKTIIGKIDNLKSINLNSKEYLKINMKNELNSAIYDFQDQINNISNINKDIDNEIPIIQNFFILFGILKKELKFIFQKETENFTITSRVNEICKNCSKRVLSFKKEGFVVVNLEKIKNLNINDLNTAIKSLSKSKIENKICSYCPIKNKVEKEISLYNTSKYLIIFIDRGENCKNKDFINFEDNLTLDGKDIEQYKGAGGGCIYKLYGVIVRKEKNKFHEYNKKVEEYVYYTRKPNEDLFIRNDEIQSYKLIQIKSEGDIMALFYYCQQLDKFNNYIEKENEKIIDIIIINNNKSDKNDKNKFNNFDNNTIVNSEKFKESIIKPYEKFQKDSNYYINLNKNKSDESSNKSNINNLNSKNNNSGNSNENKINNNSNSHESGSDGSLIKFPSYTYKSIKSNEVNQKEENMKNSLINNNLDRIDIRNINDLKNINNLNNNYENNSSA